MTKTGKEGLKSDDKVQQKAGTMSTSRKRKAVLPPESDSIASSRDKSNEVVVVGDDVCKIKDKKNDATKLNPVTEDGELKVVEKWKIGTLPKLETQYFELCSYIRISNSDFQAVITLIRRMRETLKKRDPRAKLTLFRHWKYWNLKPALRANKLLIYLSRSSFRSLEISYNNITKMFKPISIKPNGSKYDRDVEAGYRFVDEQSGLKFELVTRDHYHAEVVISWWARYLLKFDRRARSLLDLVYFWARENGVVLRDETEAKQDESDAIPADPGALEWLCLFYLGKQKIIPTPMEIMKHRSYRRVVDSTNEEFIPFPPHRHDFLEEWKSTKGNAIADERTKEYVMDVMRLAPGFFQFFSKSNNCFRGSVLQTYDSKIMTIKAAVEQGLFVKPTKHGITKTFRKEQEAVKKEWKGKMCLLQPFVSGRYVSICQEKFEHVLALMKNTVKKLDFFLKSEEPKCVGLKSLFRAKNRKVLVEASEPELEVDDLDKMVEEVEEESRLKYPCLTEIKCQEDATSICTGKFLGCHFASVLKAMLMSKKEEDAIKDVQKQLNKIFGSAGLMDCRAILFRGGHLKFGVGSNSIIFFLDHADLYTIKNGSRQMVQLNYKMRDEMTKRFKSKFEDFDDRKDLLLAPFDDAVLALEKGQKEILSTFSDPQLGLEFSIAPRSYFPEFQANRLVQYLCTFDPRVKPLMAVILYWAKMNQIKLGKDGPIKFGFAPDPALLEWLVLYFLWKKGIVPSPRDLYFEYGGEDAKLYFDGVNIGFNVNPEAARHWREAAHMVERERGEGNILQIHRLAQKFFAFCCKLGAKAKENPLVVDLKSFYSFRKDELDECMIWSDDLEAFCVKTKVTMTTLKIIEEEPWIEEEFYSQTKALTFLHPLHVTYGFDFCSQTFLDSVCPKMSATEKQLSGFLMEYENIGKRKKKKVAKMEYNIASLLII